MIQDVYDQIREKDHAVLTCIRDDQGDTRKIRETTTLSNRDVNYSLNKLEDLDLIKTKTPEGRVTQVVNGQKRNFKAPRKAALTELGRDYFATTQNRHSPYHDLTHEELVERVQSLEEQVRALEERLEAMRKQVWNKLSQ